MISGSDYGTVYPQPTVMHWRIDVSETDGSRQLVLYYGTDMELGTTITSTTAYNAGDDLAGIFLTAANALQDAYAAANP